MNDPRFYEELTNRKLRVVDNGFKGDFRVLHLLGSHVPYVMDENAKTVAIDDSDLERQTLGAIKIVSEYIRQMKELGVYDTLPSSSRQTTASSTTDPAKTPSTGQRAQSCS